MVNFVALILYYCVYNLLREKKLLKRYTPKNTLKHLSRLYKLKVDDKWYLFEIRKKESPNNGGVGLLPTTHYVNPTELQINNLQLSFVE